MGTNTTPTYNITQQSNTPWNADALNAIASQAASYYGSGGTSPYYGATYAGLSPLQKEALGYMESNVRSGGTTGQAGENLLGSYLTQGTTLPSYLKEALGEDTELAKTAGGGYLDVSQNPYIASALGAAGQQAGKAFSENILPALRTTGVSSGMYPSSRQALAEGVAASDLQNQLNQLASQYYMGEYQTERQNQINAANTLLGGKLSAGQSDINALLSAIGKSPEFSNLGASELYTLGGIQQSELQKELDAMQSFYNAYNAVPAQNIQSIASILAGQPAGMNTTQTSTTTGTGNNMLGNLGSLASIAGTILPFII